MPLELHRDLILPPDATPLWRYMDFAKFVHLLETKSLWFLRTDHFEDPLEGTYTDAEIEYLKSLDANNATPELRISDGYLRGPKYMRMTAYASCWRAGAEDSMAMWDLYGKGSGIVAVKTTVGHLKEVVSASHLRIFLGEVSYVPWNEVFWNNNNLVMCFRKDSSYRHEAEVRAIIWDPDIISGNMSDALVAARSRPDYPVSHSDPFILRKDDGRDLIEVAFPPDRFVTEIVIRPRERRWVTTLVGSVLKRYGLTINLRTSDRLIPR